LAEYQTRVALGFPEAKDPEPNHPSRCSDQPELTAGYWAWLDMERKYLQFKKTVDTRYVYFYSALFDGYDYVCSNLQVNSMKGCGGFMDSVPTQTTITVFKWFCVFFNCEEI
jgi:hypothetical protein